MSAKHFRLLLFIPLLALLHCGGPRQRADGPGREPRVALQERYAPGRYRITVDELTNQRISFDRQTQDQKQLSTVVVLLDVQEPDAEGRKAALYTFQRLKIEDNGVVVDTDQPPVAGSGTAGLLDKALRELLATKITIHFAPDDTVESVDGFDELWSRLGSTLPQRSRWSTCSRRRSATKRSKTCSQRRDTCYPMTPSAWAPSGTPPSPAPFPSPAKSNAGWNANWKN